jgi:CDP-glucose 4,6-dehydratase
VGAAADDGVSDFWQGRHVFVTGHTGFVGGWLALALAGRGARVTGFALPPLADPSFYRAIELHRLVDGIEGDVRDISLLASALATAEPEIVLHLAAQPLVRRAYDDPVETFSTNVMGTVCLMQALRGVESLRAAIVMTTDKVYESREWLWGYREEDRLGGREPYGVSKACAEHVVDAFRHSYFAGKKQPVGVATVRAGNVIGGGDFALDRLVPDAARAFSRNLPLRLRNPNAVRPWQHVLDPVCGILTLAERLCEAPEAYTGCWNLGPAEADAKSVAWIADRLVSTWGEGATWTLAQGAQPYEARHLALNSTKAIVELGWRPRWNIEAALDRAVAWYKAHLNGRNDMRGVSLEQIDAHAACR